MRKFITLPKQKNEDGNLLIWYVCAFFVLMGVFGIAVDMSFNTYSRNTLQNSLDSAVVAAASKTQSTAGGRVVINKAEAKNTIAGLYTQNRKSVPDAVCLSKTKYKVTKRQAGEQYMDAEKCWVMTDFKVNTAQGTITASVREYKPNYFMRMIGVPTQEMRLTSTARLTHTYEQE